MDRYELKSELTYYNPTEPLTIYSKEKQGGLGTLDGSAALLDGDHLQKCVIGPLTKAKRKCAVDKAPYEAMEQRRRKNIALQYGLPWNEDEGKKDKFPSEQGSVSAAVAVANSNGKQKDSSEAAASSSSKNAIVASTPSSDDAGAEWQDDPTLDEIDYNARFLKTLYNLPNKKWHINTFSHHVRVLRLSNCNIPWQSLKVISEYVRHNGALTELKLNDNKLGVSVQLPVSA